MSLEIYNSKANWSELEEETFVNVFLRAISEGARTKQAAAVAVKKLAELNFTRTIEGSLFRWYSILKNVYEQSYKEAKALGKNKKFVLEIGNQEPFDKQEAFKETKNENITIEYSVSEPQPDDIIQVKNFIDNAVNLAKTNKILEEQVRGLQEQLKIALSDNTSLKQENTTLQEDIKAYHKIFEQARKLAVEEENGTTNEKPTFKMDKNGNLERI